MYTFVIKDFAQEFGDKACLDSMRGILKTYGGAPEEQCTIDFKGSKILPGTYPFIFATAKQLNAKCINLDKKAALLYERMAREVYYTNVPFSQFKDRMKLKAGEFVIIIDNLYQLTESVHACRILEIAEDYILVQKFYKAFFRVGSAYPKYTKEMYRFEQLYNNTPAIRRPLREEAEAIQNVVASHKGKNKFGAADDLITK